MIKKVIYVIMAVALSAAISGCSKSSGSHASEGTTSNNAAPAEVTEPTRISDDKIRELINEGDLNADDLSAESGVVALKIYYEKYQEYRSAGNYKASNEAMRDFVDIYEIVASNRRSNFDKALNKASSEIDLKEIYTDFVDRLSNYQGRGSWGVTQEKSDSASATPADSTLAPELRPAE